MNVSVAVSWPGIISFLVLLALGLIGFGYYTRSRHPRSVWFWAVGMAVCLLLAYVITVLVVVPLLLRVSAGTDNLRPSLTGGRVSPGQAGQVREIPLEFTPEPVEVLPPGEPEKEWKEQRSIVLTSPTGEGQVTVRLHIDASVNDPFLQGEVWGLLDDGTASFDLGMVGNYGLQGVDVRPRDMNGDGRQELVITGGMGATYGERKIIGYDPGEKQWLRLLTMGTPWDGDLDGDGQEDVVATSGGSLPGYVWIYRWNKDHYEKADVAESTGNVYASIDRLEGTVWIETGKPNEPHYYQYRDGKLVEFSKPTAP
ncbi:hypothetical protein SY88_18970 [Clostridiales bacterium PH28_bin88]|nr:hypothetical protein SY88_18970 [Clostridiales bacterium PH28_bin88]